MPLKALLQLLRIPNVFTTMADVLLGFAVVHGAWEPVGPLLVLLLASVSLYLAGMVLNDAFDAQVDAVERPGRPIPSGRIPLAIAFRIGAGLMIVGILASWSPGMLWQYLPMGWRAGAIGTALAGAVLLYDIWLKKTPLGPLGMGLCRTLNVLLGMSLDIGTKADDALVLGFAPWQLLMAGGVGLYIVGVTIFAKKEADKISIGLLALGILVMLLGLAIAGSFVLLADRPLYLRSEFIYIWYMVMGLLAMRTLFPCLQAIIDPTPDHVQRGVRNGIWSLILLDAVLCLAVVGPIYAVCIAALLLPTMTLGKWVYST